MNVNKVEWQGNCCVPVIPENVLVLGNGGNQLYPRGAARAQTPFVPDSGNTAVHPWHPAAASSSLSTAREQNFWGADPALEQEFVL